MKITPLLDQYDFARIEPVLKRVPLFEWILQTAPEQVQKLLHYCRLLRLQPGEMIIKKGEVSQWIYILIQGECFAFVDESDRAPINHLRANDIFGEVAAILKAPRIASIIANFDHPETLLLGINFSIFSDPDHELDLSIKILMYQAIQRTIFKRLRSVYRDLEEHENLSEPMPPMKQPPRYISDQEKIEQLAENCQVGAKALHKYSDRLSEILN